MRLEILNNLPLNTVTPNFVAIFVFFGTASWFIERIFFSEIEAKREANQCVPKALFSNVWYILIMFIIAIFRSPCD